MSTRRRSPVFTAPVEEEMEKVEEFLNENATEMFETISRTEEEAEEKEVKVGGSLTATLPEITPTDDVGPRFTETPVAPITQVVPQPAPPQPRPKRHPRNIPKFSRYK